MDISEALVVCNFVKLINSLAHIGLDVNKIQVRFIGVGQYEQN